MSFDPTPEQQAIIEHCLTTRENIIIKALAGAAKTSTLVLIAQALKNEAILCLAFNKRIATEMQERLPGNCQAMTLNSLGHRVWGQAIGKRLIVDTKKNFKILSGLVDDLSRHEKEEAYDSFSDILKAIELGKVNGYVPTGKYTNAKGLMNDDEFFACLEEEPSRLQEQLIRSATILSYEQAWKGMIDFSDQILMPTLFPASFPQYPLVMIDEAQDLSALNHATLRKLARKRLIAVGDECQSIYGFRGAHQESMEVLESTFNMTPLILSVSFRCPKKVVVEARWRAPHMKFPDWAREGEVQSLDRWSVEDLPDPATIICRNNAPIFNMAIRLLKNGRYPQIVGNDLGKNLIKIMKKFGPTSMPVAEIELAIEKWEREKLQKTRNESRVYDQAECFRIFARQGKDLGDAIAYAEHIMAAQGPITLMTGHKSKGLEFDDVFFLDRHLIRLEEQQEQNLLYVIQTRAKSRLVYVLSETFEDSE